MASKTPPSDDLPTAVDMAAFGVELTRRRAALGEPAMPRNAGNRRTRSKRALLKAIEESGGKW